jgi:hypothetical protein
MGMKNNIDYLLLSDTSKNEISRIVGSYDNHMKFKQKAKEDSTGLEKDLSAYFKALFQLKVSLWKIEPGPVWMANLPHAVYSYVLAYGEKDGLTKFEADLKKVMDPLGVLPADKKAA